VIEQRYYVISENQRDDAIVRLLETEDTDKCLVFCRMKREVDRLSEHLVALGFNARGLHGDMEQQDRDEVIKGYRRGEIKILVATDVAARGLDVKNVSHVFNYHIPFNPESYVHRIGRTGRAGKSGQAITLVSTEEFRELQRIQKEVGAEMQLATIEGDNRLSQDSISYVVEQLQDCEIDPNANLILKEFADTDQRLLLQKALSWILATQQNQLSDSIGMDQEMVDEMMELYLDEQKAVKKGNKKKRR